MKRRSLLQGMVALPLIGALSGCDDAKSRAKGTLKVILHGPFGVVTIRRQDQYRVIAFVPSDPFKGHELRFRTPMSPVGDESHGQRFQFELQGDGIEINSRPPYRDHGFDDFNLGNIGDWQPEPDRYFVFLDLPAPDVITFIPPAKGVIFRDHRTGVMPLDQILEYRMHKAKDVRLHSKELGNQPPMSCRDLVQEYHKHWASPDHREEPPPSQRPGTPMSQRPYIDAELARCSDSDVATYFLGVGLPETKSLDPNFFESHGVRFFNNELLKAFFQGSRTRSHLLENRINRLQIDKTLNFGESCQSLPLLDNAPTPSPSPSPTGNSSPVAYREWMPAPRLRTVASGDDCHIGGASACGC